MGHIIVRCQACKASGASDSCRVIIDGTDNGRLGQVLDVSSGQRSIHIDCPENCCPQDVQVIVGKSSAIAPQEVELC